MLSDKADSVTLRFTTDDSLMVGSNGILSAVRDLPGGKKQYEWKSNYPIAYYLISFAVADYMDYSFYVNVDERDSLPVQNFIYNDPQYFQENKKNIDTTGALIRLFSEKFGRYPFYLEKYGHSTAPLGGGMEHQTMTTLGSFDFRLVAHELAHQWFGNSTTCENWQDIWINEGFASYCEYIAFENFGSGSDLHAWLTDAQELALSEPEGSVFVPGRDSADVSRIFNYSLSYRKGAYLLHMLRNELENDEMFFNILRVFLKKYANQVASARDFFDVTDSVSGSNFSVFFDQWYYGEGYPVLYILWSQRNDTLTIKIQQESSSPVTTPFFNLLIDFRISYLGGDTLIKLRQSTPLQEYKIKIGSRVSQVSPNPGLNLLARIGSVTKDYNPDSLARFVVFPNPSENRIYIENSNIGVPFLARLYNYHGVLIDEISDLRDFVHFDISRLPKGVYQVVISQEPYSGIFKVAKL